MGSTVNLHLSNVYMPCSLKRNVIENKFVNRKLEKGGGGDKSVPRAPVSEWSCCFSTKRTSLSSHRMQFIVVMIFSEKLLIWR
jgi:hypothetical protein